MKENRKKSSRLLHGFTDGDRFECGEGLERGDLGDPTRPLPASREAGDGPGQFRREEVAGLWRELREAVPASVTRVALEIDRARTVESGGRRAPSVQEIVVARALLGSPRGGFAPWSRTVPLQGDRWPRGWLPVVARQAESWSLPPGPAPREGDAVWLDVFAGADLLRMASGRWLREGAIGERVAAAGVEVVAPGSSPESVVVSGVLAHLPRGPGQMVRESWRLPPRPGWGRLRLSVGEESAASPEGWWVTRLHAVGAFVVGAGFWADSEGQPCSRWGPLPLEGVEGWLEAIVGFRGPAVIDGAGVPVEIPLLRLNT